MSKLNDLAVAARRFFNLSMGYLPPHGEHAQVASDLDTQLRDYEQAQAAQKIRPLSPVDCDGCALLAVLSPDLRACTHSKVTTQGTKGLIYLEADICYRSQCKGNWKVKV